MKNDELQTRTNPIAKVITASLPSILAILAGFLLGFIILFVCNPGQAFDGIVIILKGGFSKGMAGVGQVFYYATPIIMTGLAVGFAFKTGLFNIGAPGQFIVGAFVAVYIGVKWTFLPGPIHWLVCVVGAAVAGGIWGILPGLLKATRNVNEVITCIMMNYIGMNFVNMMIKATVYNELTNKSQAVAATANIPKWGLDKIFPYNSMNGSIIIAIIIVIIAYILLNKTVFGYELKACGFNKDASKYAGINAKRSIVLSMVIAGMCAGIGGSFLYLSGAGKYIQVLDVLANEGFTGISVALLGLSNPIGILFAGLFIAHITVGGFNLQLLSYDQEIINIIIASIIYFSAFSLLFKSIIERVTKGKQKNTPPPEPALAGETGGGLLPPEDALDTTEETSEEGGGNA